MDNTQAVTIWKGGDYKVWGGADAFYARTDPDFLVNIPLGDLEEMAAKDKEITEQIKNGEVPERMTAQQFAYMQKL